MRAPRIAQARASRIVVPLHDLAPGGTERIAIRLADRWAALGREVTLVCGVAAGALAPLVGDAVEVVTGPVPIPRGPGGRARLGRAVARRLERVPADLLFVPGNHHWPVAAAVAARLRAEAPAIAVQASNPLRRPGRSRPAQLIFEATARRRLRGADLLVTLSDEAQREAQELLAPPLVLRLPLPALDDEAPPPRPAPRAGAPMILAAGRFVPQKGFDTALRAFAAAGLSQSRLVILGDGPGRDDLQALARALGVAARVEMPGHVPDIRPWLDRCDLFLLTSRYEGYGAVVVEALAAGRPVVATACGPAPSELLLGAPERGRVAPVDDPAAIARAMAEVLADPPPNPAALAARVAEHRLAPVAQAYLDLFDAACARRAAARSPR
ncbi:MAG: glycosyltransferase [Caulobacteraceae bacterium]|nr:glycosyltransferase [Caulobacter sp.]